MIRIVNKLNRGNIEVQVKKTLFIIFLVFFWLPSGLAEQTIVKNFSTGDPQLDKDPKQKEKGARMNTAKHPTHRRTTAVGAIILGLLILSSFCIHFYSYGMPDTNLHKWSTFFGFVCLALFCIWIPFRGYVCKCPSCKIWLFKQPERETGETRKFICKSCNTIWDTGVVIQQEEWDFPQKSPKKKID